MKKLLSILSITLISQTSFGVVNILDGIGDVKFKNGTSTISFENDIYQQVVMTGRGDKVELISGDWYFVSNFVEEDDIPSFATDRFNPQHSDYFTIIGTINSKNYDYNFIKWQSSNPRLRLMSVTETVIPEPKIYGIFLLTLTAIYVLIKKYKKQ